MTLYVEPVIRIESRPNYVGNEYKITIGLTANSRTYTTSLIHAQIHKTNDSYVIRTNLFSNETSKFILRFPSRRKKTMLHRTMNLCSEENPSCLFEWDNDRLISIFGSVIPAYQAKRFTWNDFQWWQLVQSFSQPKKYFLNKNKTNRHNKMDRVKKSGSETMTTTSISKIRFHEKWKFELQDIEIMLKPVFYLRNAVTLKPDRFGNVVFGLCCGGLSLFIQAYMYISSWRMIRFRLACSNIASIFRNCRLVCFYLFW